MRDLDRLPDPEKQREQEQVIRDIQFYSTLTFIAIVLVVLSIHTYIEM